MDIVAGGGKYGSYAVEYLKGKGRGFVVVDTDSGCLAATRYRLDASGELGFEGEYFVRGDLKTVLNLMDTIKPDYVFPTVPTHLAADLAGSKFSLEPWVEGINEILPRLPQAVVLQTGNGSLIVSFNKDHRCIDRCSMPRVCPTSGIRKPCTMVELMMFADPEAIMLISYSMAPGLGALKGSELIEFFRAAEGMKRFVVATACDCHGVFTAFQRQNQESL